MSSRNTFLDVLRTVAILSVLLCHTAWAFRPGTLALNVLAFGGHGVDLFFVLSGWLLGSQLLAELNRTGRVDVRRFWLRRWLRTLPAYYAVLALVMGWMVVRHGWDWVDPSYFVFGQTYFSPFPYFGVSWSLCVEEHFYLLIAPAMFLIRWPAGRWILGLLLLVPSVCRWFGPGGYPVQTHLRFDQCGVGVLLAYVALNKPATWAWVRRWAGCLAVAGLGLVGYSILARVVPEVGLPYPSPLVLAVGAAAWVALGNSSAFWQTRTAVPLTRYLADRSYAIYLLHPEVIAFIHRFIGELDFGRGLLVTCSGSLLAAELLYRCVERPFIRSRERLAWARKPGEPTSGKIAHGEKPVPG